MPVERRRLVGALASKGFVRDPKSGRTDHDVYRLVSDGRKQPVLTKVSRGTKYRVLGNPLVLRVRGQMHLDRNQFDDFVGCPISQQDYLGILRAKGLIE